MGQHPRQLPNRLGDRGEGEAGVYLRLLPASRSRKEEWQDMRSVHECSLRGCGSRSFMANRGHDTSVARISTSRDARKYQATNDSTARRPRWRGLRRVGQFLTLWPMGPSTHV